MSAIKQLIKTLTQLYALAPDSVIIAVIAVPVFVILFLVVGALILFYN